MKRRRFLLVGAMGIAVLSAALVRKKWNFNNGYRTLAMPDMLSRFLESTAIVKMGRAYCRLRPDESQPVILAGLIAGDVNFRMETQLGDAEKLSELVGKKVRDDFAHGRVVQLDGWVLSRTEAWQCALLSILPNE